MGPAGAAQAGGLPVSQHTTAAQSALWRYRTGTVQAVVQQAPHRVVTVAMHRHRSAFQDTPAEAAQETPLAQVATLVPVPEAQVEAVVGVQLVVMVEEGAMVDRVIA